MKFRVIEGTIWEIEAPNFEQAKQVYDDYFNGKDVESDLIREIEGSSYWFDEPFKACGACGEPEINAYTNQPHNCSEEGI